MWSTRLFWKVFLVYAGLNLALAAAFLVVVANWQKTHVMQQVEEQLHDTAIVLGRAIDEKLETASPAELQQLFQKLARETNTRMTLIAADGVVLADSQEDPSRMQNHRDRPELKDAAGPEKFGTSLRRSPTLGIRMLYLALPIERDGKPAAFVQVAMDLQSIDERVASIQRLLWLLALGVGLLAVGLTYTVVGRIVRPLTLLTREAQAIAAGEEHQPVTIGSGGEIGALAAAFQQMQRELDRRLNQLQGNNQRMLTVLGSMDEGVIAVDESERILLANEASRSLLGFVTAEAVGRPLLEVTRSRPIQEAVAATLRTGRPTQTQFEVHTSTRRMLSLRATCLPGQPCPGVVIVLHDVSELRRLENLRREFVTNVSHELKTPLSSIKAYAETLRLGAVNDTEHNLTFVTRIEEQAERLHQLILDLIHIARVESGQEAFDITEVPVAGVVESCLQQHTDAAAAKRIQLAASPPAEPLLVRADEEGVLTILDNLVDNAIKYTPEDGRVTVRWTAEDSVVVLEVVDTGIGIAPQDQPRVFERFFRVDKARSRELGGTGLGLSIVKHLAQAFGGSVGIDSRVEHGSTFRVKLPRVT
jgi:two-component system phosphate regulon sensor histidine kinase PhoR